MDSKQIQEKAEELWDTYSEGIGERISDLDFWAGRDVMTKETFLQAVQTLAPPAAPEPERGEGGKKSLRWVNAMHRLPKNIRDVVCIRGDGGGEYFYEACDTAGILEALKTAQHGEITYEIEWLEEYTAQAPPPLTGNDLSDTNVGNIVQRAENQVTGRDVEGEAPEEITMWVSDNAAGGVKQVKYDPLESNTVYFTALKNWRAGAIAMWRKMQEQIAAERKHAKYGLELLSDRCKELETQLSAASTRISELQRELTLEIDTRKVLSDQLAAEKSFNENSKALDEKNGMEAEGLRLSIQKLRDAFREDGFNRIADRINGLLTNK